MVAVLPLLTTVNASRSLSSPATAGCKALFALNIEVSRIEVDVNVTPDKRTVMLIHENQLLALLRKALEAVWDPSKWQFSQSLGASGNARNSEKYDPPTAFAVMLLQCLHRLVWPPTHMQRLTCIDLAQALHYHALVLRHR